MKREVRLLGETLEIALTDERFGERFYERLFGAHPEVQPMFKRNSTGAQQKMFAQKLCAIVDAFDDPELLRAEARKIAQTHADYGVAAEMYAWIGAALVGALRESAGASWSDDAERVWQGAYDQLARAIVSESG